MCQNDQRSFGGGGGGIQSDSPLAMQDCCDEKTPDVWEGHDMIDKDDLHASVPAEGQHQAHRGRVLALRTHHERLLASILS